MPGAVFHLFITPLELGVNQGGLQLLQSWLLELQPITVLRFVSELSLSPVGDLGIHCKRKSQFWPFSRGWATHKGQGNAFDLQLGPTEKQELQYFQF